VGHVHRCRVAGNNVIPDGRWRSVALWWVSHKKLYTALSFFRKKISTQTTKRWKLCGTLRQRALNPIKLAYSPSLYAASTFNGLGQYVSSPRNRAYCYAELAVSSLAMAIAIANTYFRLPTPFDDTWRLICSPTTPPSTNCYHPRLLFEPVLTYGALQMLTTDLLTFVYLQRDGQAELA